MASHPETELKYHYDQNNGCAPPGEQQPNLWVSFGFFLANEDPNHKELVILALP